MSPGGHLADRHRQLDEPLGVALELVDRVPEEARQQERDELEPGVVPQGRDEPPAQRDPGAAAWPASDRRGAARPSPESGAGCGPAQTYRRQPHSDQQPLQRGAQRGAVDVAGDLALARERDGRRPPRTPRSPTASVSSVSPMAARWRVPRVFETFGLAVSGRKQPAAVMRPFWMMSAPSWIGESGRKMLVTSSRDTRASRRVPTSMYSFSPTSCCSTMQRARRAGWPGGSPPSPAPRPPGSAPRGRAASRAVRCRPASACAGCRSGRR